MQVLVTGATGKVGNAIARALHGRGDEVTVLARDPAAAAKLLPENIEVTPGDVTDPASVAKAMANQELVFNAMGIPEQWVDDEGVFERVNARGSETVARAAREAGVRRLVQTSTIDVFEADADGRLVETAIDPHPKHTAYERSKQLAEKLVLAACDGGETELVFVNPAAVYGPGPGSVSLDESLFRPVARGRMPPVPPGGMGLVHERGVASGHLLAAEKGRDRERYILCDRHGTMRELAQTVVRVAGTGRVPPVMPTPVARATAISGDFLAARFGIPPLISRGQLEFLLWNAKPDSTRAQEELGWEPTPLEDGIRESLGL